MRIIGYRRLHINTLLKDPFGRTYGVVATVFGFYWEVPSSNHHGNLTVYVIKMKKDD